MNLSMPLHLPLFVFSSFILPPSSFFIAVYPRHSSHNRKNPLAGQDHFLAGSLRAEFYHGSTRMFTDAAKGRGAGSGW